LPKGRPNEGGGGGKGLRWRRIGDPNDPNERVERDRGESSI